MNYYITTGAMAFVPIVLLWYFNTGNFPPRETPEAGILITKRLRYEYAHIYIFTGRQWTVVGKVTVTSFRSYVNSYFL